MLCGRRMSSQLIIVLVLIGDIWTVLSTTVTVDTNRNPTFPRCPAIISIFIYPDRRYFKKYGYQKAHFND